MHIEEDSGLDHQKFYGQTINAGHQTHFEEDSRLDFQPHVEQERNIDCRTKPEQKHQVCCQKETKIMCFSQKPSSPILFIYILHNRIVISTS